jgi:hypothetical protein
MTLVYDDINRLTGDYQHSPIADIHSNIYTINSTKPFIVRQQIYIIIKYSNSLKCVCITIMSRDYFMRKHNLVIKGIYIIPNTYRTQYLLVCRIDNIIMNNDMDSVIQNSNYKKKIHYLIRNKNTNEIEYGKFSYLCVILPKDEVFFRCI